MKLLPPGHTMVVSDGRVPAPEPYWDYRFGIDTLTMTEDECVDELFGCFGSAAVRQLVSDVPVGSYLSGGMDSGSLTAIASSHCQAME